MKHTGRLPSVLLALCLALGVAAWSAQGARAEAPGVDYVGADGRTYNTATDDIAGNDAPTRITGTETGFLPAGWYVVDDTLEYNDESAPDKRLKFEGGGVHIILAGDCKLTAPGIHCLGSLTIYGQAGGTGTIVSSCPDDHGVNANGSLTIHGGAITATSSGWKGICCVSFRMTGGRVTVQGRTGGISGGGTAEIGFRTADDYLSLETQAGAVFSDFASVTIADGQVMTDGTNFYTERLASEQFTALNGKTLQLVEEQCEAQLGGTKYAAVQTALNAAAAGQTVTLQTVILLRDVTTAATLTIPAGADVTLDLNGHAVDRGLADEDSADNGSVIKVNGTLTLADSSQGKAGTLTGGNTANYGGGVFVDNGGTFRMSGGTICGNAATDGGGVYVETNGAFTMEGGTISGNTANYGGGVYVYSTAFGFTMIGGTISGNTANYGGGGVHLDSFSGFEMTGGVITGNNASYGGGVDCHYCSITVGGSAVISGNVKGGAKDENGVYTGGTASNALLGTNYDGSVFNPIFVGSPLTGGAHIGVTMPSSFAAGAFTIGLANGGENAIACFTSDDEGLMVVPDQSNELTLRAASVAGGAVCAPAGAMLLVASYDNGRMTTVKIIAAPENGWRGESIADVAAAADYTLPGAYKLMLLGSDFAPLCEAFRG